MRSSEGGETLLAQAKMAARLLVSDKLSEGGAGCWMDDKSGYSMEEEEAVDGLSTL